MSNYNITLQSNNADLQAILTTINGLPEAGSSVDLPTLTNEGKTSDLLYGKELINSNGIITIGSMPNNGAITSTMDGINTKSISIPYGFTSGGTVSLDNTIDNEVNEQADLIAQIMSTVNSLPEAGSSGGSGNDTSFKEYFEGTMVDIDNDSVTTLKAYAFRSAITLKSVSFPNVTSIGVEIFRGCNALTSINFPRLEGDTGQYMCGNCGKLVSVNIPRVTTLSKYSFQACTSLEKIDLGNVKTIAAGVFSGCSKLNTVIIRRIGTTATTLSDTSALSNTLIANGTGYVYVPSALVDAYKTASNWSSYANQIRAIEDYPDICGV